MPVLPRCWRLPCLAPLTVVGLLVLGVLGVHALALPLFSLTHVAGMFGLRCAVHALTGVDCRPDDLHSVRVFEGGKDAVGHLSVCLISRGMRALVPGSSALSSAS